MRFSSQFIFKAMNMASCINLHNIIIVPYLDFYYY